MKFLKVKKYKIIFLVFFSGQAGNGGSFPGGFSNGGGRSQGGRKGGGAGGSPFSFFFQ